MADYAYDNNWKRMFTVVSTYNKKIATYIKMEYLCIPQGGLLTLYYGATIQLIKRRAPNEIKFSKGKEVYLCIYLRTI